MAGNAYEKEYQIHYYEIDYRRKALITSIVDYLGDAATSQAEELGIGMDYLMENRFGWVLYKWDIDMYSYPHYNEKITIRTWAHSFRKFYAYRRYEFINSNGEIIGKADSIWFLINMDRRRPVRINEHLCSTFGVVEEDSPIDIENITAPSKIDSEKLFDVRYSDIDTNGHVNNTKYIAWAIETVPKNIVLNYTLNNLKVTYEKETTYGEAARIFTEVIVEGDKYICHHKIIDNEDKELTLLKTTWVKNDIFKK